jgi:beta-lactam-binding protein with PASTA domain
MGNLWLFLKSKTFAVNAVLALLFFIVLGMSAQSILKWVTGFGEVQTVPDLSGMSLDDAQSALAELELEGVLLDSAMYRRELRPREVYQQYPVAGAVVKAGRQVMLKVNRSQPELITMPNVIERTLMRAEFDIKSRDLNIKNVEFVQDIADGLVLQVKLNGRQLSPGSTVRKGSYITLVVGRRNATSTLTEVELQNE